MTIIQRTRTWVDFAGYVSISVGMALAASSFSMLAALFSVADALTALLAIPLAGALSMIASASIGALASRYPSAPGVGSYLARTFGSRVAIIVILLYLSLVGCLAGAESYVFVSVLERLWAGHVPSPLEAMGVIALVVALNLTGLELPRRFQLVAMAVLGVSVFIVSFVPLLHPATGEVTAVAASSGRSGWISAVGMAVFLFLGFEWVTPLGRSRLHYARLVPMSMPAALLILVAIYGAFAAALSRNFPVTAIASTAIPQFLLAGVVSSRYGTMIATAACVAAMTTAFNAGIMGGARIVYATAREGSLPKWCARLSPSGVPYAAVLLLGGTSLVASFLITHYGLVVPAAAYAAAVECFVYGALMLAALQVRTREPLPSFKSPAPAWLQWLVALLMPLLGIGALCGDAEHSGATVWFFVAMVGSASIAGVALDRAKQRRRVTEVAPRPQTKAVGAKGEERAWQR